MFSPGMKDGVYEDMAHEGYLAEDRVSASLLKDLANNPGIAFARNLDENRSNIPTQAMQEGTALHMAVLEPDLFQRDCGVMTLAMARELCKEHGVQSARSLEETLKRLLDITGQDFGFEIDLSQEVMDYIRLAAPAMHRDLGKRRLVDRELSVFWTDKATGLPCKARFDGLLSSGVYDIKKIAPKKDFEKACIDALQYSKYAIQAVWYVQALEQFERFGHIGRRMTFHFVHAQYWQCRWLFEFSPITAELAWQRAEIDIHNAKSMLLNCMETFGQEPWRNADLPHIITDDHFNTNWLQGS